MITCHSDFGYLVPFRRYFRSLELYEIGPNLACFRPNFFGERAPEFLDLRYKAHPDCDHVAKFHGDRPRELGDLVAKQIKKEKKHQQ